MAGSPQLGLGIDFTNDTAHFMPRTCDIGRNEVDTGNIKPQQQRSILGQSQIVWMHLFQR